MSEPQSLMPLFNTEISTSFVTATGKTCASEAGAVTLGVIKELKPFGAVDGIESDDVIEAMVLVVGVLTAAMVKVGAAVVAAVIMACDNVVGAAETAANVMAAAELGATVIAAEVIDTAKLGAAFIAMVVMAAAVVAHRAAEVVRHGRKVPDQRVERFGLERGVAGDGLVEIVHVSLVMTPVMDFHRQRVNMRFQGFLGIG